MNIKAPQETRYTAIKGVDPYVQQHEHEAAAFSYAYSVGWSHAAMGLEVQELRFYSPLLMDAYRRGHAARLVQL